MKSFMDNNFQNNNFQDGDLQKNNERKDEYEVYSKSYTPQNGEWREVLPNFGKGVMLALSKGGIQPEKRAYQK